MKLDYTVTDKEIEELFNKEEEGPSAETIADIQQVIDRRLNPPVMTQPQDVQSGAPNPAQVGGVWKE